MLTITKLVDTEIISSDLVSKSSIRSKDLKGSSDGKASACNAGDRVQSLGREDPMKKEMATPLQYSCLENFMDRGTCQATVHGVAESQTQLSE